MRRRFHAGGDRIFVACVLERAALAGGDPVRGGGWPRLELNFNPPCVRSRDPRLRVPKAGGG